MGEEDEDEEGQKGPEYGGLNVLEVQMGVAA